MRWLLITVFVSTLLVFAGVELVYRCALSRTPFVAEGHECEPLTPLLTTGLWASLGEAGEPRMTPVYPWHVVWVIWTMSRSPVAPVSMPSGSYAAVTLGRVYLMETHVRTSAGRFHLEQIALMIWVSRHRDVDRVLEELAGGHLQTIWREDLTALCQRVWHVTPMQMTPLQVASLWTIPRGARDYRTFCRLAELNLTRMRDNGAVTTTGFGEGAKFTPSRMEFDLLRYRPGRKVKLARSQTGR